LVFSIAWVAWRTALTVVLKVSFSLMPFLARMLSEPSFQPASSSILPAATGSNAAQNEVVAVDSKSGTPVMMLQPGLPVRPPP